jgi:hypothetical protein
MNCGYTLEAAYECGINAAVIHYYLYNYGFFHRDELDAEKGLRFDDRFSLHKEFGFMSRRMFVKSLLKLAYEGYITITFDADGVWYNVEK